jgi:hypothetical protein
MESNDPSRALRTRRAVTYAPQRSGPTSAGRTRPHLPTPRPGSTSPPAWAAAVDLELPPARVVLRTYAYDLELSSLVIEMECEFGREAVKTEREMRAADTPAAESRLPPTVCRAPKRRTRAAAAHPRWPFPAAFPGLCDRPRGRSSTCRPTRTYRQRSGPTARDRVGLRLSQAHRGGSLLRSGAPRPGAGRKGSGCPWSAVADRGPGAATRVRERGGRRRA